MKPKVAMCNILPEMETLKAFAGENGFQGIDWSFDLEKLPATPLEESRWVKDQSRLCPFEVRYHCPFYRIDLGHEDPARAKKAAFVFQRIIRLLSRAGGRFLTIHIGLGQVSTETLSWDAAVDNLRRLVQFGADHGVKVCLENLAWGWTSKPNLFEKLIRRSSAGVTLDIGHAYVCESVSSQLYNIEDFVSPHGDRVFNAHIYHTEMAGAGHVPPERLEEIADRLALLEKIRCPWWVIELKEPAGLLQTKRMIDEYLRRSSETSEAASVFI